MIDYPDNEDELDEESEPASEDLDALDNEEDVDELEEDNLDDADEF